MQEVMAKIDSLGIREVVGDNRHSPLRIVDAKLDPYEARPQESRDVENKISPRRSRMSKKRAEQRVKEIMRKARG